VSDSSGKITPPIDRFVKQARLERLIKDGEFQKATQLARELGLQLPRGQVVDLRAARARP